jgi:hypothetical protein
VEKVMRVLPSRFYGDPVDCVDERIRISEATKRQEDRDRIHKGRRIRALVRKAISSGGDKHGR